MRSKDTCHVGDFISQCSSCLFFADDLKSGKNIIQVETEIVTPWNWQKAVFTAFVEQTDPFYDMIYKKNSKDGHAKIVFQSPA